MQTTLDRPVTLHCRLRAEEGTATMLTKRKVRKSGEGVADLIVDDVLQVDRDKRMMTMSKRFPMMVAQPLVRHEGQDPHQGQKSPSTNFPSVPGRQFGITLTNCQMNRSLLNASIATRRYVSSTIISNTNNFITVGFL